MVYKLVLRLQEDRTQTREGTEVQLKAGAEIASTFYSKLIGKWKKIIKDLSMANVSFKKPVGSFKKM